MFRAESGREIPWGHEQQIFKSLNDTLKAKLAKDEASYTWQIALCYHVGFGTPKDPKTAQKYALLASNAGHPVAKRFSHLVGQDRLSGDGPSKFSYIGNISALLQATSPVSHMPPLVKACFQGDIKLALKLLSDKEYPSSTTVYGCTGLHWLALLEDESALRTIAVQFRRQSPSKICGVNAPFHSVREAHGQWPLQLMGTPLSIAISVNNLKAVKVLLTLGADATALAYCKNAFPREDLRSKWTAAHIAAKYHCSEILEMLLQLPRPNSDSSMHAAPLACALSFSTPIERRAIHGGKHAEQLDKTISIISGFQNLKIMAPNGMTALMQAIDFQDYDVVAALLRAEPGLATTKLCSPRDERVFNLPLHFAAQIAARRDVPETLLIPKLINSYSHDLDTTNNTPRDSSLRTPLHMAVTGPSARITNWILKQGVQLLDVEDAYSMTPLHYCASALNCDAIIGNGANVNHIDKYGMTALHRASYFGSHELVLCLLKHKSSLELKNSAFGTPLHCAVINGSVDVVIDLLDAGAPVNSKDKRGNTPIHVAARLDRHVILRILMQRGGDISIKNENGRKAQDIAVLMGRMGSVGVLRILQRGWEVLANNNILDYDPEAPIKGKQSRSLKQEMLFDFLWDKEAAVKLATTESSDAFRGSNGTSTHESEASFDEREQKMTTVWNIYSQAANKYFPHLHNKSRIPQNLMVLMSVYFDESLWNSALSTHLITIMAYTAFDICQNLVLAECRPIEVVWMGKEKRRDEEENAKQVRKQKELSDSDSLQGRDPNDENEKRLELEPSTDTVSTISEGEYPDKTAVGSPSQPSHPFYSKSSHLEYASEMVAMIVGETRPAWFLPGRTIADMRELIVWEVGKLEKSPVQTEAGSDTWILKLFQEFPQLQKREANDLGFLKWRESRLMSARRMSSVSVYNPLEYAQIV